MVKKINQCELCSIVLGVVLLLALVVGVVLLGLVLLGLVLGVVLLGALVLQLNQMFLDPMNLFLVQGWSCPPPYPPPLPLAPAPMFSCQASVASFLMYMSSMTVQSLHVKHDCPVIKHGNYCTSDPA